MAPGESCLAVENKRARSRGRGSRRIRSAAAKSTKDESRNEPHSTSKADDPDSRMSERTYLAERRTLYCIGAPNRIACLSRGAKRIR